MTLTRICTQVQTISMPLYFQHLGASITVAGLSMTAFTIAAMLFRPFVGALLDQRGRKPLLIIGLFLYALSTFAYGLVTMIPLLIVLRIIHGASFSASSTSTSAMITDILPEKHMTQGLAYYGMFGTLSIALAPSMTLYFIDHATYTTLFSVTSGLSVVALLISLVVTSERSRLSKIAEHQSRAELETRTDSIPAKYSIWNSFIVRKAFSPVLTMLSITIATSAVTVFLPTYSRAVGIPGIGLFYLVQAAALAASSIVIGHLSKKWGAVMVIRCSLLALGSSIMVISLCPTLWAILLAAALFGFANGLLMPELNALAVLSAAPNRRGQASAMFYLALDIGIGTGAAVWGWVSDTIGIQWIYIIAGCLPFILLLVSVLCRIDYNLGSVQAEQQVRPYGNEGTTLAAQSKE
ncbi:MFS transporter [Paenibacillus tianjinensis]|uniref:MFS transporter n=2 Tax=Paenibacillus tianjinensis TaxID=2810347 RepID=A0ABX7LGI9_9BACL|nr:MFS transporter [Paenibacillus tianjinensis]QSF45062.1 MFS transporter [Paenibacillus tianjinensis]